MRLPGHLKYDYGRAHQAVSVYGCTWRVAPPSRSGPLGPPRPLLAYLPNWHSTLWQKSVLGSRQIRFRAHPPPGNARSPPSLPLALLTSFTLNWLSSNWNTRQRLIPRLIFFVCLFLLVNRYTVAKKLFICTATLKGFMSLAWRSRHDK